MKNVKLLALCMIFIMAGCDKDSSIGLPDRATKASAADKVVYFPDGGGVEFAKSFLDADEGAGWNYREFTVGNNWVVLRAALKKVMLQQEYEYLGEADLQGFEYSMSFAKNGSPRKVNYRARAVNTLNGGRLLLRVSCSF